MPKNIEPDQITHIFFDLDHTIWDYEKNSRETLQELYLNYHLENYFSEFEAFFKSFTYSNNNLWELYNQNKIDKAYIRENRFRHALNNRIHSSDAWLEDLSESFLNTCCSKPHLVEGARKVLEVLNDHYQLNILSNGFTETQTSKLHASDIINYFDVVVTSESTGYRKPAREIFDYALDQTNALAEHAIMIGDNLVTDIQGSLDAGWSSIWYNPQKRSTQLNVHEIHELKDLIPFFLG